MNPQPRNSYVALCVEALFFTHAAVPKIKTDNRIRNICSSMELVTRVLCETLAIHIR